MIRKSEFWRGALRIPADIFAGILGWALAYDIRPWTDLIPNMNFAFPIENLPHLAFFIPFTLCSAVGLVIILASLGLYTYPSRFLSIDIFGKILWGIVLWAFCILAYFQLVRHEAIFSRIMLVHALLFSLLFSTVLRFLLRLVDQSLSPPLRVLLVGNTEHFASFPNIPHFQVSGKMEYADVSESVLENFTGDEVLFFEKGGTSDMLRIIRQKCAEKGILLRIIPRYASEFWGHAEFEIFGHLPTIRFSPTSFSPWWYFGKRLFDAFFSTVALLLLSPLFFIIAIFIKMDSSGPVFYISQRMGRNGVLFSLWKFRSMKINADQEKEKLVNASHRDGPLFKIKNDPRVTRVGKILRRLSLDELPQLWNVVKGEMSLIGPRPHLPEEIEKYEPEHRRVLAAKPGITGLAQVSGRSDLAFGDEIFFDLFYLQNASVLLDTKIFLKTLLVLIHGKGAD
ncbi:MAG: sugar transferase [Candidatus Peregrinibacteria bacterium]